MPEHEHEHEHHEDLDENTRISMSVKALIALFVYASGMGGMSIFLQSDNKEIRDEFVQDVGKVLKTMDKRLEHIHESQEKYERQATDLADLAIVFTTEELHVRKQHDAMAKDITFLRASFEKENESDQRFHRSMDKIESLTRSVLRNMEIHNADAHRTDYKTPTPVSRKHEAKYPFSVEDEE